MKIKLNHHTNKKMSKSPPHHRHSGGGGGTNCASCILATAFLLLLLLSAAAVYFLLFKPKNPKLAVTAVRIPNFAVAAANSTVTFNLTLYVTVSNPNRAVFTHYDSSLQLLYAGNRVGLLFVPAGKIAARKSQHMAATFSVRDFPVAGDPGGVGDVGPGGVDGFGGFRLGPGVEVETRLEVVGRVRVLRLFMHRVEARADCTVAIGVSDGSVLGLRC